MKCKMKNVIPKHNKIIEITETFVRVDNLNTKNVKAGTVHAKVWKGKYWLLLHKAQLLFLLVYKAST